MTLEELERKVKYLELQLEKAEDQIFAYESDSFIEFEGEVFINHYGKSYIESQGYLLQDNDNEELCAGKYKVIVKEIK